MFQWMGEKIKLSSDSVGVCFASITTPSFAHSPAVSHIPPTLLEAFKTCNVQIPERKLILKALFLAQGFENAIFLAESLETTCKAVEELLNTDFVATLASDIESGSQIAKQSSTISIFCLKTIVALAQKHMLEFGALLDPQIQATNLQMPSVVYSEFSESTRASLKFRTLPVSDDLQGNSTQQMGYQKCSLEEFALILSLKDTLLSSLPLDGKEYSTIVRLLRDLYPSCDLQGLLDHEASVREGMTVKAREDREAVESVRESRAASAMQMVQEDSEIIQGVVHTNHIRAFYVGP